MNILKDFIDRVMNGKITGNNHEKKGNDTMNESTICGNCETKGIDTMNESIENPVDGKVFDPAPEYGLILGAENPMPHCAVMLVLDTSHSMWGAGLADMMDSLEMFFETLRREQFANAQIDIAAVSLGDRLGMLEEFTPFAASQLPKLKIRPKGDTPFGAALALALGKIDEQLANYEKNGQSHVTPQLILLSDGESSDDFTVIAEQIRGRVAAGKLISRAIATGENPDLAGLRSIAGDNITIARQSGTPRAFAEVGKVVSQVYEGEAEEFMTDRAPDSQAQPGTVYIDGTNVMFWKPDRSGAALEYLLGIVRHFDRTGVCYKVLFDASSRYKLGDGERTVFEKLLNEHPDRFVQVPARTRADEFLLMLANGDPSSRIMSNDIFRQYANRFPWIADRARFIRGMVMGDQVFLSDGMGNFQKIDCVPGNIAGAAVI